MRLLRQPRNLATWALLTRMALELELVQQSKGADSPAHRDAFTFWDLCTCGFEFIATHGRPDSKLIRTYTWNQTLDADATCDLQICKQYTHFLNIFPPWHSDHQGAEILPDGRVRFAFERDSPQQRRVIAFQQTFRPHIGMRDAKTHHRMQLTPEQQRQFADLRQRAESRGSTKKLKYEIPAEMIQYIQPYFQRRLDESFRYPDSLQLDGYLLREFKLFFAGLLTICGIHERICYPFLEKGHPIPESSMVLVKPRSLWITELVQLSGLSREICERIIAHLTMDSSSGKAGWMTIYPFVPLDRFNQHLAVAPQFPLAARSDDNILRAFSYRSPAEFSGSNTKKESILRRRILDANSRFNFPEPVRLPDGSTDLDLIIEDTQSSTLVLAELKWIRKPLKPGERAKRNEEIEKGIQQIHTVRRYAYAHPGFLKDSRRLARAIDSYSNVHFLLIVADHWFWVDPDESFAILDFQVFLSRLAESTNLQTTVSDLLTYNWLPVEGVDFRVDFVSSSVNGAVIESPTFYRLK